MSVSRRSFVALAATAPFLRAQSAQERGRDIAQKAIQALGGDGFRLMRTRTEIGKAYSFYRDKITGLAPAHIYTEYLPEGTSIRERQREAFGKKQEDIVVLTGDYAWETTFRGSKPLPSERLTQFKDTVLHDIFYILRARIDEPRLVFEHKGKDVVELRPVEVLEIYDSENRNITAWIHSDTFLPVSQRFHRWDPVINDRREEITHFTKYRDAGNGVVWPHDVQRERDKEKVSELYSDKVTVGDDFKPGFFDAPK